MTSEIKTSGEGKPKNKGGRPRKPLDVASLIAHPEMQEVLRQTAAQAVQAAVSAMGNPGASPVASAPGTPDWMNGLAMAIVQAGDPKRKPLDPKIVEQRQSARDRMNKLIATAVANVKALRDAGDDDAAAAATPEYELTREIYVEEQLIQPTYMGADRVVRRQRIGWMKPPSQVMTPTNAVAKAIKDQYLLSVGGVVTEGKMPDREIGSSLSVYQDGKLISIPTTARSARQVGSDTFSLRGHAMPGVVVETNVLGTRAAPARQLA